MSDGTRTRTAPSARLTGVTRSSLRVTVVAGPDRSKKAVLEQGVVVIGRGEGADVRLADPTVSHYHVELSACAAAPEIEVRDLGSRNGTLVGDVHLHAGRVPSGTSITIGSTTMRIELGEPFEAELADSVSFGDLIGSSASMRAVYAVLERLARTDLSLLLEGETGTGKEVAARSLHARSPRALGPFLVLDCAAIPASLAESVLFGHERGAFTGATERRPGIFEAAQGGTLLLDEVGELPLDLQPKLLRVLERREVRPVGAARPRPIDVRVVSATWRDLREMMNRGTFREDLYFRLAGVRLRMPSLAERRDDVTTLALHFLARIPSHVEAARAIAPAALDALAARRFPGNVRELAATVERVAVLAAGPTISQADLAFERRIASEGARGAPDVDAPADDAPLGSFREAKQSVIDAFERGYLERLLSRTGRNVSRAAALAGITRHSLRDLLRRHGLDHGAAGV